MRSSLLALLVGLFVSTAAYAEVVTKEVDYKDGDVTLKGVVVSDSTMKAPDAAVVIVPEWWGVNDYSKTRARQLAELGYVSFVADMYGGGQNTTDAAKAKELSAPFYADSGLMIRRVAKAVEALEKQPGVVKRRVAVLGYCFGGTSAIAFGLSGAPVAGVVSFHGGLKIAPSTPAKVTPKFLILNGDTDPFVPVEDRDAFLQRLRTEKTDFTFVDFAGALHAFTNPNASKFGIPGIAYSPSADKQSWEMMKQFLSDIFARK